MRLASWMSLGMMVTRLAWMAARLVSSNRPTRYASAASCSASTAEDWKRRSVLKSWAISLTRRWKGSLRISSSVDFWYLGERQRAEGGQHMDMELSHALDPCKSPGTYLRISRRATVPGR